MVLCARFTMDQHQPLGIGSQGPASSPEMRALMAWLHIHIAPLVSAGERAVVTLHIQGGDVKADLERKGLVMSTARRRGPVVRLEGRS